MKEEGSSYEGELDSAAKALEKALEVVRGTRREGLTAVQWMEISSTVGRQLAEVREASASVRQNLLGGARTAILLYLRGHVGQVIAPQALEGVAGIRAWARRIRELRAMGWEIECLGSGPTAPYRLTTDHLDASVAHSDQIVAAVTGAKPKERIIEYLLHLCPWPVTSEQIEKVAGVPTWRQELRELIDDGWHIQSHDTDPDLTPGSYRLAKLED